MKKRHITTIISDREVNIKHIAEVTKEDNHIDLYNSFTEEKITR